ncbi:hypothetical protein [Flavisolibacter tropicus]|uniref:Outer membrane protein beta-barrel domain-containing protein n=1 Tax=Flavisolibacter tropicus TaxID=1492898 RepID=A0A172TYD3_9BACT|nr:hypothetical protein [Flavisolibacter tropicus]ANE51747.1 hypothetical protein SY85_15840 [Flavisolibacter tropicus]
MKPAALLVALFLYAGMAAHSQWRFLPQMGIDNLKSSLYVNDQKASSTFSGSTAFKAALRTDYLFKGGHGPYFSVGSSPSAISLSFANPENLTNNYSVESSGLQWRLEGGYGFRSKPIYFKKGAANNSTTKSSNSKTESYTTVVKKSCGTYTYTYRCHRSTPPQKQAQNEAFNLRLQPSIGMAYLPSIKDDIVQEGGSTTYRAGNWNTGFVSALGFELAKGARSFLTLQLSYTKGIGNLDTRTVTTAVDGKTVVTSLRSTASSWSLTAGVPISITKKTTSTTKSETKKETSEKCKNYYYKRCSRTVI